MLVSVQGRPILHHLLTYLSTAGVRNFVLCVGHHAREIERFARTIGGLDGKIRCVNSGDVSMTDRILDAVQNVSSPTLICYGDTLADVDLDALELTHRRTGALATVTVYPLRSPFGIVEFDNDARVLGVREKPVLPYWINIGFLRCDPQAFRHMKQESDLVEFCAALSEIGALSAFQHRGQHITVNTEKDLMDAEAQIIRFATVAD